MSMYEHGIVSLVSANFMTLENMQNYFWSSSSPSHHTSNATGVHLADGDTYYAAKTTAYYAVCVR
jgi:hypothetical protein